MRTVTMTFQVSDEEIANLFSRAAGPSIPVADPIAATPAPIVAAAVVAHDDDNEPTNESAPLVDKNNVAWHQVYHAKSKAITAEGVWRRARNLTDAQKAEADSYEKSGVAPVVTAPAIVAPVAAVAMPGLPGVGLPQPTAEVTLPPISYQDVVDMLNEVNAVYPAVMGEMPALYAASGVTDPNALETDETLRRKLYDAIKARKPA